MRLPLTSGRSRAIAAFVIVLGGAIAAPAIVGANSVDLLAPQNGTLLTLPTPPAEIGSTTVIRVAQSQSEAQLTVRIQELEDTVRTLTGQVEGLQFQLTQMQELLQKQQEDNEFRFQQLEGGAGKKTDAATQTGGATPPGGSPQGQTAQTDANALPAPAPLDSTALPATDVVTPPGADVPQAVTTDTPAPVETDGLGESADPLVGTNKGGQGELGTLPEADPNALGSQPLDLSLDGGQDLSDGDAVAQYKAGYDAVVRGDYPFAEDQFRQFIALYPKDKQAPDATNWLGEALIQQGEFDDAVDVLFTGFKNYGSSERAPDILLRLGIAMNGSGEMDTACRTFFEVTKRYPNQPAAFQQKLQQEKEKAQCPVQ